MVEQMAIGCILGDSYITKSGCLQVEHSLKQKDYIDYKYRFFLEYNLTGKTPTEISRFDKRTGKTYKSLRFYTKAKFQQLRTFFYPNKRKVVPKTIDSLLISDLALAVWFMDDGGRGANTPRGQIISVAGFDLESRNLLKQCLFRNYQMQVRVYKNGQMYIPIEAVDAFHRIVSPRIIPSIRYKLEPRND